MKKKRGLLNWQRKVKSVENNYGKNRNFDEIVIANKPKIGLDSTGFYMFQ